MEHQGIGTHETEVANQVKRSFRARVARFVDNLGCNNLLFFFRLFCIFGRLECVGHSFAYVAHFVF
jgi:hypothetical protein